ncbi:sensor histidine kinase [Parvibaculum sp. MBR-TMA-1.3b-4.2]|jgi:two-component system sensor histidine kinase ChvG
MASVSEDELSDRGQSHADDFPADAHDTAHAAGKSGAGKTGPGEARSLPTRLLALIRLAWSRFRSFLVRGRFSSLTRRIVVFNVVALIVMVAGILYINQFREGLIDARRQSLLTQAEIIAGALAQGATEAPRATVIDPLDGASGNADESGRNGPAASGEADKVLPIVPEAAAPILRRLTVPTRTRARLYDRSGWLLLDSRRLSASAQVVAFELPPPADADEDRNVFTRLYQWMVSFLPGRDLELFKEAGGQNGKMYQEVTRALTGQAASMERVNDRGELIVSVAVPIQRYRAVLGALMLSTRGGDIDAIVRGERFAILQVFLVTLGVTILLSVVLAATIAEPVRRLAESADIVRRSKTARAQIPDFTERRDEIGDLSGALRDMTNALYSRIDAIESFAADVAHELKNPLTSLSSAIETIQFVKTDEQRQKLNEIIKDDLKRIDRLISDISNASRLDAELAREETDDVNIATLLEAVCDLFTETGVAEGRRVMLDIDPGAPGRDRMVVKGFDMRLGQVVRNLVDNALSFSPEGAQVKVIARREPGNIVVMVEDQGPGIPEDSLEKIFDRFHTDRPDSFGKHSGLGLAISRQIVEAHGGTIRAENRMQYDEVQGARFIVTLPAAPV